MREYEPTVLQVEPGDDFVVTPSVEATCKRALAYLNAGYAVHLSGPTGTGKTTLAMHIAKLWERPVVLVCGDEEYGTSDLVGGSTGVTHKRVIDNFIHSVLKTEQSVRTEWVDNRVTTACKHGYTLIYDEFNRSRPEANNALLAVLEEGILPLPEPRYGETYIKVHPDFRAIFTSNPEEYAGVHKTQDALVDRMITIRLNHYDRDTEIAITMAKSGVSRRRDAEKIVDIVRGLRRRGIANSHPTIRTCIMIAKVAASQGVQVRADDPIFLETCIDAFGLNFVNAKRKGASIERKTKQLIEKHCSSNNSR